MTDHWVNPLLGFVSTPADGFAQLTATTRTSDYTAACGEYVRCNAVAGGFTVTFPDATLNTNGVIVVAKRDASGNIVTLATTGGQTFESDVSSATMSLTDNGEVRTLIAVGSTWELI